MAELVLGLATSHLAMVLREPRAEDAAQVERFRKGFAFLAEALDQARVDTLVLVSGEHVNKFFLDNLPAFAVGTAPAYGGPVEDIPIEPRGISGADGLGRRILDHGMSNGVDWARVEEWTLDHGMMVPLHYLDPENARAVVPVFVNCAAPPCPALRRCHAVGGAIAEAIESWTEPRRVAIVACGGLSHSPGDARMGFIDEAFDREFLGYLHRGEGEAAAAIPEERIERAGSSTAEIRAWLTLAGAFPGRAMEVVTYEPVRGFGTGCAQGIFLPGAPTHDADGGAGNE